MDILRADTYKPSHSYNSSDSSSYDRVTSLPRSESGTSQTHYEDNSRELSPKDQMNGFARNSFGMDRDEVASKPPPAAAATLNGVGRGADPMDMHILLEAAVSDSKGFQMLSPEGLESLKKEEASVARKIDNVKRNLSLETKVRSAAQSMNRLGGKGPRSSADTKELVESTRKCEEMAQELLQLERQLHEARQQRLEHTAAVLQAEHQQQFAKGGGDAQKNGWRDSNEWGHGFGFGALANTADGIMDLDLDADGPSPNVQSKLRSLNDTLSRLLESMGQSPPQLPNKATADQEMDCLQSGLNQMEEVHAETSRLWDVMGSGEEDMRQQRLQRSLEQDDSVSDDDDDDDDGNDMAGVEPFSLQAFSAKVQRLCNQAASLQQKQFALKSQLGQERSQHEQTRTAHATAERSLAEHQTELGQTKQLLEAARSNEDAQTQLQQSQEQSRELEQKMQQQSRELEQQMQQQETVHEEQRKQLDDEKEQLQSEVVRLTTEVTMARAELDGAYGTRAERAAEASKPEMEQLSSKNEQLGRELGELVAEHEALVRQGVEAERDRETLEGTIDNLREKLEQLEVRLHDEKVRTMAAPTGGSGGNAEATREATSMGVMRTEFKKMMREARAEHFRNLRMEQEERRRLEALIRTLRRDQGQGQGQTTAAAAAAAAAAAPPSTLSPQPMGKSKLAQTVTA